MAMKGCSAFSKPQHYWSLTIRLFSDVPECLLRWGSYPSAAMQSVYSTAPVDWAGLMLDRKTWNHSTVCKLFVLRIVTWSYNCLQMIIISSYLKACDGLQIISIRSEYLKPYNCVLIISHPVSRVKNIIIVSSAEGQDPHTHTHTHMNISSKKEGRKRKSGKKRERNERTKEGNE